MGVFTDKCTECNVPKKLPSDQADPVLILGAGDPPLIASELIIAHNTDLSLTTFIGEQYSMMTTFQLWKWHRETNTSLTFKAVSGSWAPSPPNTKAPF